MPNPACYFSWIFNVAFDMVKHNILLKQMENKLCSLTLWSLYNTSVDRVLSVLQGSCSAMANLQYSGRIGPLLYIVFILYACKQEYYL